MCLIARERRIPYVEFELITGEALPLITASPVAAGFGKLANS